MNFSSKLGLLRIIGFLEGLSWIALLTTMTLKYGFDIAGPNKPVGQAHGFLFIAFVILVFIVARDRKWNISTIFWCLAASFFPFGTFIADAKIFRKEALKDEMEVKGQE